MNLLQRYKNYTQKEYDKYLDFYEFKPHYKWNIFDVENSWVYDNEKWRNFIWGWQSIGYAWEAWSYWMRDMKYSYKLPFAFWSEIGIGWYIMYNYAWNMK